VSEKYTTMSETLMENLHRNWREIEEDSVFFDDETGWFPIPSAILISVVISEGKRMLLLDGTLRHSGPDLLAKNSFYSLENL
jgi:hypothetical protein